MRYIRKANGEEWLNADVSTVDSNQQLEIYPLNGYAGTQGIDIEGFQLSWEDVDKLKRTIAEAEKLWRTSS